MRGRFRETIKTLRKRLQNDASAPSTEEHPADQLIAHMYKYVSSIEGARLRLMRDSGGGVYLHTLRVTPEFRRKRIGTGVMSELIKRADELDILIVLNSDPVDADHAPDHAALCRFYNQFGFDEDWDYVSDLTAVFDGQRDGTWTRMLRSPNTPVLGIKR